MGRRPKLPKVLTQAEQERLLEQFNTRYPSSHRNLCIIRTILDAGLRAGEIVAVRPEYLDITTCKLLVREGKGRGTTSDALPSLDGQALRRESGCQ